MPTKEEIFEKIQVALVEALGVDDEDVTPDATLVGDLGAESIDFLDIVFRLEKTFEIKIPRGELFPEDILTDSTYVQEGRVTAEGVEKLKKQVKDKIQEELDKKKKELENKAKEEADKLLKEAEDKAKDLLKGLFD